MKKVILYIAMSLDGYIADLNKSVSWIKGQDDSVKMQDTFSDFFTGIDTVIMGKRTYKQIITELSPGKWPYPGVTAYVFTHNLPTAGTKDIKFTDADPCRLVNHLRQEKGKDIWICGGAEIINQLIKENLIDIFHIATIPVILGGGIRLFDETSDMVKLSLVGTLNYNGIVETIYNRKRTPSR